MAKKDSHNWPETRENLEKWDKSRLLSLVKDLFEASSDNRDYIGACLGGKQKAMALETYREKIVEQFYPPHGYGKLKLGEARKAIRDYKKATKDTVGVIDLMLTYVEKGTEFTYEFGDINEAYYNSLESVMLEMTKLLFKMGCEAYPQFRKRILHLQTYAGDIGWGYGDFLSDQVFTIDAELGEEINEEHNNG